MAQQIMGYQVAADHFLLGLTPAAVTKPATFAPFVDDVTAEFVLWLTLIANNALSREGK